MVSWPFQLPDPSAPPPKDQPSFEPTPRTSTFLLAKDAEGRQVVSLHAKRCYDLRPDGQIAVAEAQAPLLMRPLPPSEPGAPVFHETDIIPFKRTCDLILMAKAWGRGATQIVAQIKIGSFEYPILVTGDRRCIHRGPGSIAFEAPQPFESLPLCYELAYGGFDPTVPDPQGDHIEDILMLHPGLYPRNHVGRGYVVYDSRERIDGLLLPNLEHPSQPLRPTGLIAGAPENWWRQPLAWSCDWFDKAWYPRLAHYGVLPDGVPEDDRELAEVQLGWVMAGQRAREREVAMEDRLDPRLADAASPGLALPWLRGDEAIELTGMTPDGRLVVPLPGRPPVMHVRFEGKLHELEPRLDRVLIDSENLGMYVVWKGLWPTPRELPDKLPGRDYQPGDELVGIEAFVDHLPIEALDVPVKTESA